MSDVGYGQIGPDSGATDLNAMIAVARQLIARIDSMKLVKVVGVHPGSGSPPAVGTVDVLPLVSQIDANGFVVPHGTVYGLSCWRFQFGNWAIVADPAVNDVGYIICADRDSSAVAGTGQTVAPGSRRRYNIADGLYVGGCLNAVPSATWWLKSDGTLQVTDAKGNAISTSSAGFSFTGNVKVNGTLEATQIQTDDAGLTVTGNISATGTVTAGKGGADQVGLQTHVHAGVQTGAGSTAPPTAET